tara:strand:+ start:930 stop:1409 length:480 start_codon:yes stop_codon:yes gene_type:complete
MKKVSVLFVCLGNICRSPAAEAIFLDLIRKKGLQERFIVDSAGTGSWHIGKKSDSRMRIAAKERGIIINSKARQINKDDFQKFNYILTMDNLNYHDVVNLRNEESQSDYSKILKMQEFASKYSEKEVPDPYFGGDEGFNNVLDILGDSVDGFLDKVLQL